VAQVDDTHLCPSGYAAQEGLAGDFVAVRDAGAGGIEVHGVALFLVVRRLWSDGEDDIVQPLGHLVHYCRFGV
jgi:hypothetical protein